MKQYLLGAIFLMISAFSNFQAQNNDLNKPLYHRARIIYNNTKNLMLLGSQGIPLDHGKHKQGVYIESDFSENDINKARLLGIEVEILIEDVSNYYVEQNNNPKRSFNKNANCSGASATSYPTPANYNQGSMGGFLTLSEMLSELDDMASLYPDLISVKSPISTFQTHEGRSIYWVKISDNPSIDEAEPEVLYTAIHHAREPEAMQQLIYYMWYLLENYATNDEVQGIVENTELYFVPILNPDGYYHNEVNSPSGGGMHRKNKRNVGTNNPGVDNNRNYDFIDGGGSSVWGTTGVNLTDEDSDTYPGTGPFTEPENQAIKWFVENHDIKLALNNHSWDNSLLYPFGYIENVLTPDNDTYVAISSMMVAGNTMVNKLSSTLYPAAGDSDDFMYGETSTHNKIFAFTPEIGATGFWPNIADIDPIAESMVSLNLTSAHLVTNYARVNDLSAQIIEDASGYFHYDIQRLGLEEPANFTISIIPLTSNIISVGSANTHNSMAMLQQDVDSISYTLDPAIEAGDVISYVLSMDNGQFLTNDTLSKVYGQTQIVFSENGDDLSNWNTGDWATTTSTFYSASSSITDSPGGNYENNSFTSIELTNGIDLSNALAASLSFYAKWYIENNYDYVQLEISTDGGNSWIPQCGNYTNLGTGDQSGANNEPLYDGFQNSWVREEIDLSDYIDQTIEARFKLVADGGVTEDGFYFDDFAIDVVMGSAGIEEMTENGIYISQNIPNPSNESTTINYILPNGINTAQLTILNEMGQIIETQVLNKSSQSVQVSTQKLAQGVYYYFIGNSESKSLTQKMIVVR